MNQLQGNNPSFAYKKKCINDMSISEQVHLTKKTSSEFREVYLQKKKIIQKWAAK